MRLFLSWNRGIFVAKCHFYIADGWALRYVLSRKCKALQFYEKNSPAIMKSSNTILLRTFVLLAAALLAVIPASAATILGPDPVDSTYSGADDSGQRININTAGILLSAGEYSLGALTFYNTQPEWAGGVSNNGPLQGFIATESGGQYTIIALGASNSTSSLALNTVQTVNFGGTSSFTLTGDATVYLGFIGGGSGTFSPVGFLGGSGSTTHIVPSPATTLSLNEVITSTNPSNAAYIPALGRTYGINVEIAAVPEPGTAIFLALGCAGLVLRLRLARRQA